MEIFEVFIITECNADHKCHNYPPSRCYSEWLIPAPGESYLPGLTEAGIRKRSETISRDARLGPWKFPSLVSLPRYPSGKRISRTNLRPSLSISSKSVRSPSLPVERWSDSIRDNHRRGKWQYFVQVSQVVPPLALAPILLDAQ